MAAETGHLDLAYDYLSEAALMDLDDVNHNTSDGLHLASLAGTWIALVAGLGGLRESNGRVSFSPRLPSGITRLTATLGIQNSRLKVSITPTNTTYSVLDGQPLSLSHDGQLLLVSTTSPISMSNQEVPTIARPRQPRGRAPRPH